MSTNILSSSFTAAGQISPEDVAALAQEGYTAILCLRPDDEDPGQPKAAEIALAAEAAGLQFAMLPLRSGTRPDAETIGRLKQLVASLRTGRDDDRILAYCRSGGRVQVALEMMQSLPDDKTAAVQEFDVVIVGGGSGGIATATSLLKRKPALRIAVIEPAAEHYYQPAWTLVGAGAFRQAATRRTEASVMPSSVNWIHQTVVAFRPADNRVVLADVTEVGYSGLVVATGLTLNFDAIPGLTETLGRNGVTSNYRYDLAPYTWELVRNLKRGTAIFTQPPMPFKCAGAPQKAVYLSCDHWVRHHVDDEISVEFNTAAPTLFGVKDFVPVLMSYMRHYGVDLQLESTLVAVDGPARTATFQRKVGDRVEEVTRRFDMLHVVPPQSAPQEVRQSPLANADGFVAVDPETLQHVTYPNVFAVGDVVGTTNAKTAAAARKQGPIVADNLISVLSGRQMALAYDGYGGCPLTVENGKIVLAEFGYSGKLMPSFPRWLINARKPSRMAWLLKKYLLPAIYWNGMLKGRELLLGIKRR